MSAFVVTASGVAREVRVPATALAGALYDRDQTAAWLRAHHIDPARPVTEAVDVETGAYVFSQPVFSLN